MEKVLVNDGRVAWLADRDALVSALDWLGWEEVRVAGYEARVEPDHYDISKPPYALLCEAVEAVPGTVDDADYEFVWRPHDQLWIWRVV